jgi:hypothetical protein
MNKTKTSLIVSILALASFAALIGCGCKSETVIKSNPDGTYVTNVVKTLDAARIARASKQAAQDATVNLLTQHPEWLPDFQTAQSDLNILANSPSPSLNDLLAIVQRLPVKQLKGQTAQFSFEGATLILSAIDIPAMPAQAAADISTIARALSDGVAAGIANVPTPPAPTGTNAAPASK